MVTWYKHDIPAWLEGTQNLSHEAYRIYHIVCQRIYLHEGPIVFSEQSLAGMSNMHVLTFRKHFQALIDLGKLSLKDGKISNSRTETELQSLSDRRETSARGGRGSAGVAKRSGGGSEEVGQRSETDKKKKLNKINGTATVLLFDDEHHKTREEKKREEKKDADAGASLFPDLKTELYRRGEAVLGKGSGGIVTKLLKAKGGSINAARSVIETAADKHSPREYIGGIIRNQEIPDSADRRVDPRL